MQQLSRGEFFGTPILQRRIGDYEITQTRFTPNETLPTHVHDHDILIIMACGARVDQLGKATVECRPGSIMLQSAGVPHCNRFVGATDNQVLNLVVPKKLYARYSLDRLDSSRLAMLSPAPSKLLAARIGFEIRIADDLSENSLDEFVIEFADCATGMLGRQRFRDGSPWIADIVDYLNDCPFESFRLSEIANHVGKHPAHVARTFRRAIGCTIGTYLRHVRVSRACVLLATSNRPVVEIAADSGFTDESHLTRCMRAIFGTSPGRYRKAINQGRNG